MRRKTQQIRHNLLARLHEASEVDLILIEASNGYGKSIFLQNQYQPTLEQSVYIELTQTEAERSAFVKRIINSLLPTWENESENIGFAEIAKVRNQIEAQTIIIDTVEVLSQTAVQSLEWMLEQWIDVKFVISGRTVAHLKRLEIHCDRILRLTDADFAFSVAEISEFAAELGITVNASQIYADSDGWGIIVEKLIRGAKAGFEPKDVMLSFLERLEPSFLQQLAPLAMIEPWESTTPDVLGVTLPENYLDQALEYGLDLRLVGENTYQPHRLLGQALMTFVNQAEETQHRKKIADHYQKLGRDVEALEQYLSASMRSEALSLVSLRLLGKAERSGDLSLIDKILRYFQPSELTLTMLARRGDNHGIYRRYDDCYSDIEKLLDQASASEDTTKKRDARTFAGILNLKYGRVTEGLNLFAQVPYHVTDFWNEHDQIHHLAWMGYVKIARERLEALRKNHEENELLVLEWYCLWGEDDLAAIQRYLNAQVALTPEHRMLDSARLTNFLALIHGYVGQYDEAKVLAKEAIIAAQKTGIDDLIAALCTEAEVHLVAGQLKLAQDAYARAAVTAQNYQIDIVYPKYHQIELAVLLGEITPSVGIEQMLKIPSRDTQEQYRYQFVLGELYEQNGDAARAIIELEKALGNWDALYRVRTLMSLERAYKKLRQPFLMIEQLEKLRSQFAVTLQNQPVGDERPLAIYLQTLGQTKAYIGATEMRLTPKNLLTLIALNEKSSQEGMIEKMTKGGDNPKNRDVVQVNINRLRSSLGQIAEDYGITPKATIVKTPVGFMLHPSFQIKTDFQELGLAAPNRAIELYGGLFLEEFFELDEQEWAMAARQQHFLEFESAVLDYLQTTPARTSELYQRLHYYYDTERLVLGENERGNRYLKRMFEFQCRNNHIIEAKQTLRLWERCSQKDEFKYQAPSSKEYAMFEDLVEKSENSRNANA
jgi:hypothetical protein